MQSSNQSILNLRLDPSIKAHLMAMAQAENRTASELVREIITRHLQEAEALKLRAEIQREIQLIDQSADEQEVMRWIENVTDYGDWK
jgi:predicted DNA-binding protein